MSQCVCAGLRNDCVESVTCVTRSCANLIRQRDLVRSVNGEVQGDGAVAAVDVCEMLDIIV